MTNEEINHAIHMLRTQPMAMPYHETARDVLIAVLELHNMIGDEAALIIDSGSQKEVKNLLEYLTQILSTV